MSTDTARLARESVATQTGVISEPEHDALHAVIRRLRTMLGDTLAMHAGASLHDLFEHVRGLAAGATGADPRSPGSAGHDRAELAALLGGLDSGTSVHLARAFSCYFRLANVAEQVFRARELPLHQGGGSGRPGFRDLIAAIVAESDPDTVRSVLTRTELRPVFTAHPTESSRLSVRAILRQVAEGVDADAPDEDLAGLVDALWQTDELRPQRPTVADEAAAVSRYLEEIGERTAPDVLAELTRSLDAAGVRLPDEARPCVWAAGSAATGTATPT